MISPTLPLPAHPVIRRGCGALTVQEVCGRSVATSVWSSDPLKLLVPRPRGPSVWAYLSSFGGGLVAGDETRVDVELGPGTRCYLSTQASTKIYRNPTSLPCGHSVRAQLSADSVLVFAPDPVQAYAGSCYRQRQEFHLEPGASLVLVDWLCSGRVARGERWAFTRYESRNEVFVAGRRLLVDSLLLDPADGLLDAPFRMGRFNCLALVLIVGPRLESLASRILDEVAAAPVIRRAAMIQGASALADGVLLRLAAESAEAVGREIRRHLKWLRELLHDDPWERKW